jgi:ribosomal protein S18 acetylase RimI-like enzyme
MTTPAEDPARWSSTTSRPAIASGRAPHGHFGSLDHPGRNDASCRLVLHNPDAAIFVARVGTERAGFVLCHRRGVVGSPYLATIAVEPRWRGRGVGRELIAFVEDYFRPDARHLFLCVSSFNPRARALYERLGFAQVGELPEYFVAGASEILMHKRLRA